VYLMVDHPGEEEGREKVSERAERVRTERRDRDREKRQCGGQLSDRRLGENKGKEESSVGVNERRSPSSSQRRRYIDEGIFVQFRNYCIL
jgi:hypothetical protein